MVDKGELGRDLCGHTASGRALRQHFTTESQANEFFCSAVRSGLVKVRNLEANAVKN